MECAKAYFIQKVAERGIRPLNPAGRAELEEIRAKIREAAKTLVVIR